jgi:hypothetical protein
MEPDRAVGQSQRPPMAFRTNRVHARHARDAEALELPSYGAAAERRLEVVQGVAHWAERGLVVPAVDREGAGLRLQAAHIHQSLSSIAKPRV